MTSPPRTIAAFDFDGTMTKRDSFIRFLVVVAGWPRVGAAVLRNLAFVRRRDELKARVCQRVLRGRTDLRELGARYAETVVDQGLRPEIVERLEWHRAQGHELAIVSASLDCYLVPIAERLGIPHVLCTTIGMDPEGRCNGSLVGGNCRGPEKLRRIRAHFGETGYTLWAYGDSAGDNEMLAAADHAVRV